MSWGAIVVGVVGAGVSYVQSEKNRKLAEGQATDAKTAQAKAQARLEKEKEAYRNMEIKNAYANMENPYEDLTVNQQQAQFQAQQGAQSRADILEGLRGTAGGAGVAGLAQAMANQSALGAQRISASIGAQEARNQRLRAQGEMQIQRLEASGEAMVAGKEEQRIETLYGMDMARVTGANLAVNTANQQTATNIGKGLGTLAGGVTPYDWSEMEWRKQ